MAVSKRLRFEILRRDNHTCRYCGASAPDVKLVIDHVLPNALGGRDEPENLVTACEPCNSGKTSIAPSSELVRDVSKDALRWSRALRVVVDARAADQKGRDAFCDLFYYRWSEWTFGFKNTPMPLPDTWRASVEKFYDLDLPCDELERAVRKAMARDDLSPDARFRYFCGTCWGIMRDIQQAAADVFMSDLDDEVYDNSLSEC